MSPFAQCLPAGSLTFVFSPGRPGSEDCYWSVGQLAKFVSERYLSLLSVTLLVSSAIEVQTCAGPLASKGTIFRVLRLPFGTLRRNTTLIFVLKTSGVLHMSSRNRCGAHPPN